MSEQAPASTTTDHDELLLSWAATAHELDEFALAEALVRAGDDRESPRLHVHRARLLVCQGRHQEALDLLPDVDRRAVVSRGPETVADLVVLAALAGTGDDAALVALVGAGAVVSGPTGLTHRYLLAAAARTRGRTDLEDAAWQEIGRSNAPRTPVSVRGLVVARVAGRGTESKEASAALLDAGQAVVRDWPTPDDDIDLARSSADRLAARGDTMGAALLVGALSHLAPATPGVAGLQAAHPLRVRWVRYWSVPAVLWPVALALPVVTVAQSWHPVLILVSLVLMVAATFVRLPSLVGASDADEAVWRSLADIPAEAENKHVAFGRWATRFVVGGAGLAGALVGTIVGGVLDEDTPFGDLPDLVVAPVWVLIAVAGGVLGAQLAWRARRRLRARVHAERLAADQTREAAALKECRCWQQAWLRSISADAYVRQHLQPVPVDLPTLPVHDARTLACPLTRVRWLSVRTREDAATLLVRGPAPRPQDEVAEAPQGTGGYL